MINLDIKWSTPIKHENGDCVYYTREWIIPIQHRSIFFSWWKINKFSMKSKGFSVLKRDDDWILIESKSNPVEFSNKTTSETTITKKVDPLPHYEVQNKNGLRTWQVDAVSKIVASIQKWGAAVDGSDVGVGKCHSKGTKIRMYDGSTKNVEDIIIGDLLLGDDSLPRKVLSLASGEDEMYDIVPTNGGITWGCNGEHILVLDYKENKQTIEISVKDFLSKYKTNRHHWTLRRVIAQYGYKPIKIDAYLLGLWIGDKTWGSSAITIHKNDLSIIDFLYNHEKQNCDYIKIYKSKNRINSKHDAYCINGVVDDINPTWDALKSYGFGKHKEKFIPRDYLVNDITTRKKLLSGLIDSTGWKYKNGCYGITTKWETLKNDIIELARSLGYKISEYEKISKNNNLETNESLYYKIIISGAYDLPILVNRKKSTDQKQKKSILASSFKIINKGRGEYFGFTLDGNNRYLLEDFTVTHNTYTACAVARELNMDILVVCPKAVMESWRRVIKNHFKMWGKCISVINYESLRIGKTDSLIASYVRRRDTRRKEFVWKIPKTTLIVWDEAQKLKNSKTKNSETCISALKAGYKMLFCSATIATNPLELRTVGQGIKLFKNNNQYYDWAYNHGVIRGRFGMEFTGDKQALKKLHEDIFVNRGVRLSRDTIPNFPTSELIAECYDMEEDAQKKIDAAYDEMRLELLRIERLSKKDKKSTRLTAILRARQKVEMLKVPLLLEMISDGLENNMSVVVFCNFTETINALSERLNTKCIVNGVVSDKTRQQSIDDFQADKERVILVNIAAGGAGLSLHDLNGTYARLALICPSYSAVLMRQSTGRVWRDSAKTKSVQKIIFVANTVEEQVCKVVNQKLENLDLLNDGDLTYAKEKK
jgi:hypothetical protein